MVLDHRFDALKQVRAGLSVALYPVQYAVNFPVTAGEWMGESFATRENLLADLSRLNTQQTILNARLLKMAALEQENLRLRSLLDSSYKVGDKVLIGELMAVNLEPFSREFLINRGSRHGVYDGQPILDSHGVLGQITRAEPLSSHAMLITDPNHAIPVAINRNNLRAIAYGTGSPNSLDLPHFPANADIQVGDLLVSTGLGGVFPRGYPVAEITQITHDPSQPFSEVSARPVAQLQRSREVLMVWPNRPVSHLSKDSASNDEESR